MVDTFEMIEAGVGGVELIDQRRNALLKMADRHRVPWVDLNSLDLVDQPLHRGLELHLVAAAIARFERVGERSDSVLKARNHIAAAAGMRGLLDLGGERSHVLREVASASFEAT